MPWERDRAKWAAGERSERPWHGIRLTEVRKVLQTIILLISVIIITISYNHYQRIGWAVGEDEPWGGVTGDKNPLWTPPHHSSRSSHSIHGAERSGVRWTKRDRTPPISAHRLRHSLRWVEFLTAWSVSMRWTEPSGPHIIYHLWVMSYPFHLVPVHFNHFLRTGGTRWVWHENPFNHPPFSPSRLTVFDRRKWFVQIII